jgi:hypothetical protein
MRPSQIATEIIDVVVEIRVKEARSRVHPVRHKSQDLSLHPENLVQNG